MPRRKLTNAQFLELVKPLLDDPSRDTAPSLAEMAEVTGLSEGGVYYKLGACGLRLSKKSRYVMPAAAQSLT